MVVVLVLVAWGGRGGVFLGEVKARPIDLDIISFSLGHISKSKVQTSNLSPSPTPLDTPARPADLYDMLFKLFIIYNELRAILRVLCGENIQVGI